VLNGTLPGPYTDHDAERCAAACLIPAQLLERDDLDIDRAAAALGIAADALRNAQRRDA
jgi:hypothetical protein